MAKSSERLRARQMRAGGLSIRAIAENLRVSKSSVSLWCRDIGLTPRQVGLLIARSQKGVRLGQLNGAAANRQKKEAVIAQYRLEVRKEIGNLTSREMLFTGLGVYWGEGIKGKGTIAIANSDPKIILFMFRWLRKIFRVPKEMFRPQIFINEVHRSRETVIQEFWSSLLGLSAAQFRKIVFIKVKNKKVYENHNSYYGVLALRVRKGTNLKYKVLAYLDILGAYPQKPA